MNKQIGDFIAKLGITVVEAMKRIDRSTKGILFIVNDEEQLIGCVTDGDIRRWLIATTDLTADISKLMIKTPYYIFASDNIDANAYMKQLSITALPILNTERKIVDIIFLNDEKNYIEKQRKDLLYDVPVVIMAGGKGTRLYPFTKILPKPLIPIGDIPILERIIDRFVEYGVNSFYLTVNYKKGMIKSYFDELMPLYKVVYVEENKPLGTGGSLKLLPDKFVRPFFVTNCDILIDANYSRIYQYHIDSGNAITIVSALKTQTLPYGVLKIKEYGIVSGIEEKPSISHFINTGMYIINPMLIELIPNNTFYHMPQLIEEALGREMKVGIYPIGEDAFLDMGELEEMKKMEKKLNV